MNEDYQAQAADYGKALCEQFELSHGPITPAAQGVIDKVCYLEQLYLEAKASTDKQGLREPYNVSRYQKGSRENKSFPQLLKIQSQQAKLLRELRLLPGSRKAAPEETEDPDDELDDY